MGCRVFRTTVLTVVMLATSAFSAGAESAPPIASPTAVPLAIAPRADKLLTDACHALASEKAFTFHAEILFDEVLPKNVKVLFAGAMDFALQRPNELEVEYKSDLGSKMVWYQNDTLTILDPSHGVYSTISVPASIDGMFEQVEKVHDLTIPLSDLAFSDPCQNFRKEIIFGAYVGVGDVNGVECDHLAFSSHTQDYQLWLDRSGKPLPLRVVVNYRTEPGSPEYIATISGWKFPPEIVATRFKAAIPKDAKRIEFLPVKESQP